MSITNYILFIFLALFVVLAIRGDLVYYFPVLWNHLRNIEYYLGSVYNQYYGYKMPRDPNPSNQDPNYHPINNFIFVGLIFIVVFVTYIMMK
jgi:hypothetical protein